MMYFGTNLAVLAVALLTDRLVGDPAWLFARLPHPVVLAGRAISLLDRNLNDANADFRTRRRRGVFALIVLALAALALGAIAAIVFRKIPLGLVLEAVAVAVLLAQKSLIDHVAAVATALDRGGLEGGRTAVANIVGRDVTVLDEAGVSRAAVESAAENFSDGVVAPAFWYALLGLPGILLYKAVNTADSMIGHRSPRYEAFGWAAARLDDLLNLAPARLSALLVAAAAVVSARHPKAAIATALHDAPKHKSPNAGWPEAAVAGALGFALGGPRRYGEIAVDGAWLNPAGRAELTAEDIRAAVRLVDTAWAVLFIATAALGAILLVSAR